MIINENSIVDFKPKDSVAVLLNNLGGTSNLEMSLLSHVVMKELGEYQKKFCIYSYYNFPN